MAVEVVTRVVERDSFHGHVSGMQSDSAAVLQEDE